MSIFDEREYRLNLLSLGLPITREAQLLREIQIENNINANIIQNTLDYIEDSIKLSQGCNVLDLPNRTPNGLIVPKKEILDSYYKLHQSVISLFKQYGNLNNHINTIQQIINVRVVSAMPNISIDSRPRASSKIHSDIWSDQYPNVILSFIPIYGDFQHNGIAFFETSENIYPDWIKPLDDFAEANELTSIAQKLDFTIEMSRFYITDMFLLHQTQKNVQSEYPYRISLDIRMLSNINCESDLNINMDRDKYYIPYEDWCQIGDSLHLNTTASIYDQFKEGELYPVQEFELV